MAIPIPIPPTIFAPRDLLKSSQQSKFLAIDTYSDLKRIYCHPDKLLVDPTFSVVSGEKELVFLFGANARVLMSDFIASEDSHDKIKAKVSKLSFSHGRNRAVGALPTRCRPLTGGPVFPPGFKPVDDYCASQEHGLVERSSDPVEHIVPWNKHADLGGSLFDEALRETPEALTSLGYATVTFYWLAECQHTDEMFPAPNLLAMTAVLAGNSSPEITLKQIDVLCPSAGARYRRATAPMSSLSGIRSTLTKFLKEGSLEEVQLVLMNGLLQCGFTIGGETVRDLLFLGKPVDSMTISLFAETFFTPSGTQMKLSSALSNPHACSAIFTLMLLPLEQYGFSVIVSSKPGWSEVPEQHEHCDFYPSCSCFVILNTKKAQDDFGLSPSSHGEAEENCDSDTEEPWGPTHLQAHQFQCELKFRIPSASVHRRYCDFSSNNFSLSPLDARNKQLSQYCKRLGAPATHLALQILDRETSFTGLQIWQQMDKCNHTSPDLTPFQGVDGDQFFSRPFRRSPSPTGFRIVEGYRVFGAGGQGYTSYTASQHYTVAFPTTKPSNELKRTLCGVSFARISELSPKAADILERLRKPIPAQEIFELLKKWETKVPENNKNETMMDVAVAVANLLVHHFDCTLYGGVIRDFISGQVPKDIDCKLPHQLLNLDTKEVEKLTRENWSKALSQHFARLFAATRTFLKVNVNVANLLNSPNANAGRAGMRPRLDLPYRIGSWQVNNWLSVDFQVPEFCYPCGSFAHGTIFWYTDFSINNFCLSRDAAATGMLHQVCPIGVMMPERIIQQIIQRRASPVYGFYEVTLRSEDSADSNSKEKKEQFIPWPDEDVLLFRKQKILGKGYTLEPLKTITSHDDDDEKTS